MIHLCRLIRECNKAYKYKEMTIPEGCSIMIATHLLQKNPEYWEDPEKFDPMRYISLSNQKAIACTGALFAQAPLISECFLDLNVDPYPHQDMGSIQIGLMNCFNMDACLHSMDPDQDKVIKLCLYNGEVHRDIARLRRLMLNPPDTFQSW